MLQLGGESTARWQACGGDEVAALAYAPASALVRAPLLAFVDDEGSLALAAPASRSLLAVHRGAHSSLGSAVAWLPSRDAIEKAAPRSLHLLTAGFDHHVALWRATLTLAPAPPEVVPSGSDSDEAPVSVLVSQSSGKRAPTRRTGRKLPLSRSSTVPPSDPSAACARDLAVTAASLTLLRRWDATQFFGQVQPAAQASVRAPARTSGEKAAAMACAPTMRGTPNALELAAPASGSEGALATKPEELQDIAGADNASCAAPAGASRMVNPPFVHAVAWLPLLPAAAAEADAATAAGEPQLSSPLPPGAAFVAAAGDGTLTVLEAHSGRLLARWRAHGSAATCVVIAPPAWSRAVATRVAGSAGGSGGSGSGLSSANSDSNSASAVSPVSSVTAASEPGSVFSLPLRLFSAGNDRRLCLWELSASEPATAAVPDGNADADDDDVLPSNLPPPPLRATRLWRTRHSRGGIHSICVEATTPIVAGEPAAVILAVADTSTQVSLHAWKLDAS